MSRIAVTLFVAAICAPILAAQQPAPKFEVASVKPTESPTTFPIPRLEPGGRFTGVATVQTLLMFAYEARQDLIVGAPAWVRQDRFDISAKAENDAPVGEIKLMVQSLLKDRFKLVTHMERREMQVLALVRARPDGPLGPGLVSIDECSGAVVNELRKKVPEKYPSPTGGGTLDGCSSMGLDTLAALLTMAEGTSVIDATRLTGSFYYTFRHQLSLMGRAVRADPNRPALSTALDEQLGLKLQSRRSPVEVMVIDSVERPTPD